MASVASVSGVQFIEMGGKGLEMAAASIQNVQVAPMEGSSLFIKPQSVHFVQEDRRRRWDMVASHPSVSVILYHKELQALLLVRQFRPAVYASALLASFNAFNTTSSERSTESPAVPISVGFTYELCAGIVDKPGKELVEIAKEEVREEVGYEVSKPSLSPIASGLSAVGISGALQTYFFAEVEEKQRISNGGGNLAEAEFIDVVGLPISEIDTFVGDLSLPKSPGVLFGALWLKNHLRL